MFLLLGLRMKCFPTTRDSEANLLPASTETLALLTISHNLQRLQQSLLLIHDHQGLLFHQHGVSALELNLLISWKCNSQWRCENFCPHSWYSIVLTYYPSRIMILKWNLELSFKHLVMRHWHTVAAENSKRRTETTNACVTCELSNRNTQWILPPSFTDCRKHAEP